MSCLDPKKLAEAVFSADVESVEFLLAEQKGLRLGFTKATNIGAAIGYADDATKLVLRHLMEKYSFMVIKKAFLGKSPGCTLTNTVNPGGVGMAQDPFHRDAMSVHTKNSITTLHKDVAASRNVPTYYAAADVRVAIGILLQSRDFSAEVREALKGMMCPSYGFEIEGPKQPFRQVIKDHYPEFSDDVFALIPKDRRYKKEWRAREMEMIIHSNAPGGLLHARPISLTDQSNSVGCRFHIL